METTLAASRERYERRYALKTRGIGLGDVATRVAMSLGMEVEQVWKTGKSRSQVKVRSLLCYWMVRESGESMTAMSRRLGVSIPAVSKAVARGAGIVEQYGYTIYEVDK